MSSGGGKGGKGGSSSTKQYNIFGSIACGFCIGPMDVFNSFIVDGKALWEGTINRGSEDYIDLTPLIDASNFTHGGYAHFYWGTETQTGDPWLNSLGHPPYRGYPFLVLRNFLFGRERRSPRDVRIIAGSKPVIDTSIVPAEDNFLSDGQVNPLAVIAEILSAPYGLNISLDRFSAAEWRAIAHSVAANPDLAFCSPLIDSFEAAANILSDLADMFDGGVRWTTDGLLEVILKNWGITPDGVVTLDARHLLDGTNVKVSAQTIEDIPTKVSVGFTNREKQYKDDSIDTPNLWAQQVRDANDSQQLARKHVTRVAQALLIGAEYIRQTDQPRPQVIQQVRREYAVNAAGDPLMPGDKILVDIDPVPGGGGLAQLVLITQRTEGRTGGVTLETLADTLAPISPYSPAWVASEPQDHIVPPIAHALAVPLPPSFFGGELAVAILATRPNGSVTGFRVFFDIVSTGSFSEIGIQQGFAARCGLITGVDSAAGTVRLQLSDGATGPDAYLAARTPESDVAARDDVLLAIFAVLDGNGRVAIDSDGKPEMEFVSIIGRTAVTADTHDYTVLRGRCNLPARAWTTAAAVWIIPQVNITQWSHADLTTLVTSGNPALFRIAAFDAYAEDLSSPLPGVSCIIPPYFKLVVPPGAWVDYIFKSASTAPATPTGDNPTGWTHDQFATGVWWMSKAMKDTSGHVIGDWATPVLLTGAGYFVNYMFIRASSAPGTPTGDAPSGWSDAPPSGANPLYMAKAVFDSNGHIVGTWSAPVRLDADGFTVQYSVDGSTSWHDDFVDGDFYMRQQIGNTGWSDAIKISGEVQDGEITTPKLADSAVTTPKITPGSVVNGAATSGGSFGVNATASSVLSLTLTSLVGGQVELIADVDRAVGSSGDTIWLYMDGSAVRSRTGSSIGFVVQPAAGSHTYEIYYKTASGSGTLASRYLSAKEMQR